jgi:hypothetical protein
MKLPAASSAAASSAAASGAVCGVYGGLSNPTANESRRRVCRRKLAAEYHHCDRLQVTGRNR